LRDVTIKFLILFASKKGINMHKIFSKYGAAAVLAATTLMVSISARAEVVTFTIKWQSANGDGSALTDDGGTAVETLTLDTKYIALGDAAHGKYVSLDQRVIPISEIQALSLTIQGAPFANGTYGKEDFSGISFWYNSPLDFSKELIGQQTYFGDGVGQFGGIEDINDKHGDFNLISTDPANGPTEFFGFAIAINGNPAGQPNELMEVTSITSNALPPSVVPEPETYAMLLAGLGLAGFMARRKR
jgi:hypothetical protein